MVDSMKKALLESAEVLDTGFLVEQEEFEHWHVEQRDTERKAFSIVAVVGVVMVLLFVISGVYNV